VNVILERAIAIVLALVVVLPTTTVKPRPKRTTVGAALDTSRIRAYATTPIPPMRGNTRYDPFLVSSRRRHDSGSASPTPSR
jgi:hypothetical protein